MKNTALETTNFDFYGDELIAVQDNATGEIYTSINAVLKGIGFKDRNQIRKRRDKWINDSVISKGITKFTLPTQKMVAKMTPPCLMRKILIAFHNANFLLH